MIAPVGRGQILLLALPPAFLLPLSSGSMNPIGRLGGVVASSAAIASANPRKRPSQIATK
jgi:hypothetical protein